MKRSQVGRTRPRREASPEDRLPEHERIAAVYRSRGFLPTERNEVTEALALISDLDEGRAGGAARHLNEVHKHQLVAATDDPAAAVRSLTHLYINWADNAKTSLQTLVGLKSELDQDVNPGLTTDLVLEGENRAAVLLPLMRFRDLEEFSRTGKLTDKGYRDPIDISYTSDNGGIMFFADQNLEEFTVRQVKTELPEAISHEQQRMTFWSDRLTEVDRHYPLTRELIQQRVGDLAIAYTFDMAN